eukprot:s1164_g18.t1
MLTVDAWARREARRHRRHRSLVCRRAIDTFLVPGPKIDVGKLAMAVAPLAAHIDISCLVFFSLGVKPEIISAVAGGSLGIHGMCPVYIADCYGVIGWDKKEKKNVEMMEEGRGSEYGCPGGQTRFLNSGVFSNSKDEQGVELGDASGMAVRVHAEKAVSAEEEQEWQERKKRRTGEEEEGWKRTEDEEEEEDDDDDDDGDES